MISCVVVFDCRVTRVVNDDTPGVARILYEILSDSGRSAEKSISKLRNSHRSGKFDLSCISVWDGAGLYYCQQIVAQQIHGRFCSHCL